MLTRAREVAATEGLANVQFEQADVQVHPFEPAHRTGRALRVLGLAHQGPCTEQVAPGHLAAGRGGPPLPPHTAQSCYAGFDELSGILESIGYEWTGGSPPTLAFLRGHTSHAFVTADLLDGPLANLTSRKAVGFRITNELSEMTPYDIPRAFARLVDAARNGSRRVFGGIRFRTHFDTGITTRGVALCGNAGLRTGGSATEQEITDDLVDALVELGLSIDGPPPLSELTVVTPAGSPTYTPASRRPDGRR